MTPDDSPGGPLDVATLEVLGRRARSHDLVSDWSFRPDSISPRRLELRLDADQYPDAVDAVRIDVSWYDGGEYTVHYLESRDDGSWQCRWDRHPKPEAPTAHFHPPPDASPVVGESSIDDSHHLGVLFDVLDWVADRVSTLHE
ncbi:hypothetical protein [Halosimplex salinum]|uniref:hypothetical protein n=1 Tax=Halosimplex salinum TaxID=1710538 RepID=UPI000F492FAB|nr:hypothetical protein [Halosimplex salinum]